MNKSAEIVVNGITVGHGLIGMLSALDIMLGENMIKKLDPNDFRPVIIIDKINEIIDSLNEREAREDANASSVVEDAESSHVNEADD
jgi:hypothetical protein